LAFQPNPNRPFALAGTDVVLSVAANNAEDRDLSMVPQWHGRRRRNRSDPDPSGYRAHGNGAKYTVKITGPNNNVTSQEATITVKDITLPSTPALSLNFNDGATPANTLLAGGAAIAASGGVNGSGVLQVTTDTGGQAGAFVINDLSSGSPVTGVTAAFDVLLRSAATPADGFSFSVASDIPDDPTATPPRGLEDGVGSGLSVAFDLYDNGGGEAPAIDILYNGQTIASKKLPISVLMTGDSFAHAIIHVSNEGTVDVVYKGQIIHDRVFVPGFTSITGARYAFAGRTGGSSADQFIDNIEITPDTTVGPLRIATQPTAQTVLLGQTATFSAAANDTTGVTYQWFRNGTAIASATSGSFTTAATTGGDNAALYKVQVTKGGTVITSAEVPLTVVNLAAPTSPQVSFNFEDGALPTGTHVYGSWH
jgi:hypothetical protein